MRRLLRHTPWCQEYLAKIPLRNPKTHASTLTNHSFMLMSEWLPRALQRNRGEWAAVRPDADSHPAKHSFLMARCREFQVPSDEPVFLLGLHGDGGPFGPKQRQDSLEELCLNFVVWSLLGKAPRVPLTCLQKKFNVKGST